MRPAYAALLAALFAASVGIAHCDGVRAGKAQQVAYADAQRVDTLTKRAVKAETVYAKAKAKLLPAIIKYDTARVTDTLPVPVERPGKPDTVRIYIPRDVADTAVQMCLRVVFSCEQRHTADTLLIRGLKTEVKDVRKLMPGMWHDWEKRGEGAAVLYLVLRLIGRVK